MAIPITGAVNPVLLFFGKGQNGVANCITYKPVINEGGEVTAQNAVYLRGSTTEYIHVR
jgi:hypothetical protein